MKHKTISQNLFNFLQALEENNDRDWFADNKEEFKIYELEAKNFYKLVFDALNQHDVVDSYKMFRIYRDVRFSKNKLPYKTHFGGSFHRKKPDLRGGYYLQIKPNNESFIATGFWDPSKEDLLRIRKEFEMDAGDIRKIMTTKPLNSIWGTLNGDELKSAPKGFDKTHKSIDLIRKKQFTFTRKFTDQEVVSANFIDEVNTSFKAIRPYFDYMSEVLNTNLDGESLI